MQKAISELKNLKPYRGDWRYQTGETGKVVRVELEYMKTDNHARRGVYLRVTQIEIEQREGYTSESHTLFSGVTVFICQLERSKPKVLAGYAALLDAHVGMLAELYRDGQKVEIKERVTAIINGTYVPFVAADINAKPGTIAVELNLMRSVLANDESSSDDELVAYFVAAGIPHDLAVVEVTKRNTYLNDLTASAPVNDISRLMGEVDACDQIRQDSKEAK